MSFSCEDSGFKVKISSGAQVRAFAIKKVKPRSNISGKVRLRAYASVTYSGFRRGRGDSVQVFGASLFGAPGDSPSLLLDFMKVTGSVKVRSTQVFAKRALSNLSDIIFDTNSSLFQQYGHLAVDVNFRIENNVQPYDIYSPVSVNNHDITHSRGPQIEHSLITVRKRNQNFRFTARASVPVNNARVEMVGRGRVRAKYFEKLHGFFGGINKFEDYKPAQKLYPIRDVSTTSFDGGFVTERLESTGIYQSVNEGVFVGNITKNAREGYIISDDDSSFITPSSIYTAGTFTYKCEVSNPYVSPLNSFLFIRATCPTFTYETDIPPTYDVSNIRFEDPSGNLITKYKDFRMVGEQNYELFNHYHFVTYVTEPEINNAALRTEHPKYPILHEGSGYTLSFDVTGNCEYKSFTDGFTDGFLDRCDLDDRFVKSSKNDYLALDGSPISTQTNDYRLRPSNALRISAIEIANRGYNDTPGLISDSDLNLFTDVTAVGTLLERVIEPKLVMGSSYQNEIQPTGVRSSWVTSPDIDGNTYYNDETPKSNFELADRLSNRYVAGSITLDNISNSPTSSGKLQLLFEHHPPTSFKAPRGGAFNFGNQYTNPFARTDIEVIRGDDSFFVVEEVILRVIAKKPQGGDDFPIDVVGYSDDQVLFRTSDVGGFLQNAEVGVGTMPQVSGFQPIDDLGIASESFSDKYAFFKRNKVLNEAGDHYYITQSPVVNSTEFKEYDIPLKIYRDKVKLGASKDYTMSSFFESLYIDIYPLPVGASFARVDLVVKHRPAGAIGLNTFGYQNKSLANRQYNLLPTKVKDKDSPVNSLFDDVTALSLLENVPHGYSRDETLKTNYSRRWRGSSGLVSAGPFEDGPFSFAFSFPQLDQPFTIGFYDFNYLSGDTVLSSLDGTQSIASGLMIPSQNISHSLTRNLGMRFQSDQLFSGTTTNNYKSIDWTYPGHELYGQIIDAFDNVVRVSGVDGHLNFSEVPTSSGFAIYTRFSPDVNMSGVDYNLWNSGVIFSKWDASSNLEYCLGYDNGYLTAYARAEDGTIISISDTTSYASYQYPLSTVVTYNANQDQKLKLYTANEISGPHEYKRAESEPFVMYSGSSDLTFGYSYGSGVGVNSFISEIGISTFHPEGGGNLVDSNPIPSKMQDSIENFFDGHIQKFWEDDDPSPLWKFVDDKTSEWHLGAFQYCQFGKAYDIMSSRNGKDYVYHTFYNHNGAYSEYTDLDLPSNIKTSGIAYHTQIENDMVRFNLSEPENRFYSIAPRLTKNLPRGYIVNGDAVTVNTVLQHEADNRIVWPDGKVGAKLIVSLYTPSKESDLYPSVNYGLINRSTHYLNPEDCWNKITSTLKLGDIKDRLTEPWAYFDSFVTENELRYNYFSREIAEMFVQYDIVYPSGSYEYSKIKIHSLDVSLNDSLVTSEEASNNLDVYTSGKKYAPSDIDLYSYGKYVDFNASGILYTSGIDYQNIIGELKLYSSGVYNIDNDLSLYSITVGTASSSDTFTTSPFFGEDPDIGLPLFVDGGYFNKSGKLSLYSDAYSVNAKSLSNELFMYAEVEGANETEKSITLYSNASFGPPVDTHIYIDPEVAVGSMSMYSVGPEYILYNEDATLSLILEAKDYKPVNNKMPLFLQHYKPIAKTGNELESFKWNSTNYGKDIDPTDNEFASISADDEIRGVNTICYGACNSDSPLPCYEVTIITHDTTWYTPECIDGGIARPVTTYTNPDVPAFGTDEPYNKHFYGIRKFDNLIPQAPYVITVKGKTGLQEVRAVPRQISEWEYGKNEDVNYSGIKLTAPESSIIENQNFGQDVAVLRDMVAIGSPYESLPVGVDDLISSDDETYSINNAGKIYLYKKLPEPSGYDWSNQSDKSGFTLDQEITLPVGWRRDYYYSSTASFTDDQGQTLPFQADIRNWKNSGEGRQLGYSLDAASRGDTDIIVAGAPGSEWSRTFPPITTTPVKIGLIVFNDELITNPQNASWQNIVRELEDRDLLYRYFSDPPVEFDVQIILCEPMLGADVPYTPSEDFDIPQPDFVHKFVTNRHYSYDSNKQSYKDQEAVILQELKDIFHEVFPPVQGELHSGIPPLLGIYVDNSRSLGSAAIGYGGQFRKGALDQFIDYYKSYSSQYVKNFNNQYTSGHVDVTVSIDENWIEQSIKCIKNITSIDGLQEAGASNLIANNIGSFNNNASEFNYPPPSGGSVFIFEKDSANVFNLVQQIDSPSDYTDDVSDRFGHDVAISDDGKVIVIGSPYCDHPVRVYEYKENFDSTLNSYISSYLVTFLQAQSDIERNNGVFGEAYNLYEEYNQKLATSSNSYQLKIETYNKLSEGLRFSFFKSYSIEPYELIKDITYDDIFYDKGGSWSRLFNKYIPTARVGYSVDVNEDGGLIAIGCPTDSFGERDSTQTWFRYDQKNDQSTQYGGENWQWQNYTNAGAVRLLESRYYYPHSNKVVEYYKFGNLHEALSPDSESDYFLPAMSNLFDSMGYEYERTSFSEDKKIPQDAGLAFIITPAINAASEEIINNIKEWLAYGDRHLVLVGNDPIWESNGVYRDSNNIINNILERLDIKLKIYPARNTYDALIDDTNVYYNVQSSFVPAKTTTPIAIPRPLRGYGAGDIRLNDPDKADLYNCTLPYGTKLTSNGELTEDYSDPFAILEKIDQPEGGARRKKIYRELHERCELPIVHEGDLRAKYIDQCIYQSCLGDQVFLNYEHNLAYMYGSHTTCNDWGCTRCGEPCPPVLNPNERNISEPIPVMVGYEKVTRDVYVPGTPETTSQQRFISGYSIESYYQFGTVPYSGVDFMWSASSGNYSSLVYNLNNVESSSLFYDPDEYNGSDAILQAQATTPLEEIERLVEVSDKIYYVTEESLGDSSNSVITLIAGTFTESKEVLLSAAGDTNLNLYFNILAKDQYGSSKVAQVGGFTDRKTYQEGYDKSDIQRQMFTLGIDMSDTNVPVDDLYDVSKGYDVAWIANTSNYPSDQDIEDIKRFLKMGNKKLVITYGQDPAGLDSYQVNNVSAHHNQAAKVAGYICEKLGVSMQPLFLSGKNRYATRNDVNDSLVRNYEYSINLDPNSVVAIGYGADSTFNRNGSTISFSVNLPPYDRDGVGVGYNHEIIPIQKNNATGSAFFDGPIEDVVRSLEGMPRFNTGITKVTFDIPEPRIDVPEDDDLNLFRLYVDVISESELESEPIKIYATNCSTTIVDKDNPNSVTSARAVRIPDRDINNNIIYTDIVAGTQRNLQTKSSKTYEIDIQILDAEKQLELYLTGFIPEVERLYEVTENPTNLRTNRLLAISGVRIPSEELFGRTPIYDFEEVVVPGSDPYTYSTEVTRQISSPSDQYCLSNSAVCAEEPPIGYGQNAPEIADGSMIVAQAIYHQAGFNNGYNKSRVTVISDASIIQGKTILEEDGDRVNRNLAYFLSSLYPRTYFSDEKYGRKYETSYKIISPERASPSRLINIYPDNSGLNNRFGKYESNNLSLTHYSDTEGKKQILPEPGKNFVRQPFDGMYNLLQAGDIGEFREPPEPPRLTPAELFDLGHLINGMNKEEFEQAWYEDNFLTVQSYYSSSSKIRDTHNGVEYEDAGYQERIPQILRHTGKDHLDLDVFMSGYPGDLFGYCVKIHKDKLYVSSPFTPYSSETITSWDQVINSGASNYMEAGFNGGAGAVYLIDKTGVTGDGAGSINSSKEKTAGLPWDVVRKFRPYNLSVGVTGIDSASASGLFGSHSYSDEFLQNNAFVPDMFGYDIALDGDMMAISAPGHDFDIYTEQTSGVFRRKEFNEQFHIPQIIKHDLANEQERLEFIDSGVSIINHGAVFTYENRIADWGSKRQEWDEIHKLASIGNGDRQQNLQENMFAGQKIAIDRARRVDGDYILAMSAKNHPFVDIENQVEISGAGATYLYDGMLRKLRPAFAHPDTYISGRVYGEYQREKDYTKFTFKNGTVSEQEFTFEGRVLSNISGEIFIEVSGQDYTERGYAMHRPFISSVEGYFLHGKPTSNNLSLFSDGKNVPVSSVMTLESLGPDVGNVYNTLDLYTENGVSSGVLPLYSSGIENNFGALNSPYVDNALLLVARGKPNGNR